MRKKKITNKKIDPVTKVFGPGVAAAAANPTKATPAPTSTKTKKKKNRRTFKFDEPFDLLIALSIVSKVIGSKKDDLLPKAKGNAYTAFEQLLLDGDSTKTIKAKCDTTTALFTMRNKNSFSDEIAEKFDKYDIPYIKNDLNAGSAPNLLQINPEIFFLPQEVLQKLADVISKVKELAHLQIFLPQEPSYSNGLADDTISEVMDKIKDRKERMRIVKALTSVAISEQKIDGESEESADAIVKAFQILVQKGVFSNKT